MIIVDGSRPMVCSSKCRMGLVSCFPAGLDLHGRLVGGLGRRAVLACRQPPSGWIVAWALLMVGVVVAVLVLKGYPTYGPEDGR
jgi:hypothetical protein